MYKIVIADYSCEWQRFSKEILMKNGYKIFIADNLKTLLELLNEANFDLILVNSDMLKDELRKPIHDLFLNHLDKPIIVVSVPSNIQHEMVQQTRAAFKLGAKDYVNKPFSGEKLLELVGKLLDEFAKPQIQGA